MTLHGVSKEERCEASEDAPHHKNHQRLCLISVCLRLMKQRIVVIDQITYLRLFLVVFGFFRGEGGVICSGGLACYSLIPQFNSK